MQATQTRPSRAVRAELSAGRGGSEYGAGDGRMVGKARGLDQEILNSNLGSTRKDVLMPISQTVARFQCLT